MSPPPAELVQISLCRSIFIFCHVWLSVITTTAKPLNCPVPTILPKALCLHDPHL